MAMVPIQVMTLLQDVRPVPLAAEGSVSGLPAVLIILAILALLIIGIVSVVRFIGRRARGK